MGSQKLIGRLAVLHPVNKSVIFCLMNARHDDFYAPIRKEAERRRDDRLAAANRMIAAANEEIAAAEREKTAAQAEFDEIMSHIGELQKKLPEPSLPVSVARKRDEKTSVIDLICDVLPPKNEQFTLDEVFAKLQTRFPDRQFNRASVRTLIHRLFTDGAIVRLQKGGGDRVAVFMVAGSDVDSGPFGDLAHIEIAERVLGELKIPVTIDELVDEMVARGFSPDGDLKSVRSSLVSTMRKKPDKFQKVKDGWKLTA